MSKLVGGQNRKIQAGHITISDIARKANVSVSTVSRVLNDSAPVEKQTKRKVLKAIEELNFIPNAMARGLVKKTSKSIGFMIPDILNPFYMELIKSIEEVASKHGFSMNLCITNQDPEKEYYYINEMLERRIDGIIIISTRLANNEIMQKAKQRVEIVSIHSDIEGVDSVDTDGKEGTFSIIEYLIKLGHRKIGFLGYRFDVTSLNNRLQGYKEALEKYNIPIREEYIVDGGNFETTGYNMTKKLLNLKDRPTVIHCFNEYLAMGAYEAINEEKLKIPDDISLTGFDNIHVSKLMSPQLTTVSQPISTMGQLAAELLIKNITKGSMSIKQNIILPTELIIRESTKRIK